MKLSINPHIRELVCSLTGKPHDTGGFARPIGMCRCCPAPGKPLEVRYELAAIDFAFERLDARVRGLWHYAPLLPVSDPGARYAADVGQTPVVPHPQLSAALDCEVWIKHEGGTPSGSFKDRGLAMAIALGTALGARRFCLPTQGNAGVAASLFSARMGIESAIVYMPEGHRDSHYHRAAAQFGAEVRFHGANIAASGRRMREELAADLAAGRVVDVSTFFEPGRLEGKKTLGLEIAGHFGARLPDFIVYPTGGGTGLVGIHKAFLELQQCGAIAAPVLPAMIAVQSANCAPVVRAFERGLDAVEPVSSLGTVADGLDVPAAIMGHRMLALLRESGGFACAVEEDSIRAAYRELGALGVACGYECAATLAALRVLRGAGRIARGARVLLLDTGSFAAGLRGTASTA